MSIESIITTLKNEGIIPEKQRRRLSFGTKEQCKESFIEIFKAVDPTIKKFIYYPEYDQVIDWLSDNKGKGLALFGTVGTGKSVILRSILPVYMRGQYNKNLRVIGLPEFMSIHPEDFRNYLERSMIAIDELGREPLATDYGVKYEAAPVLIESCEIQSKLLFLTSNATRSDIISRYGSHTLDRITKLCKIVTIKQESLRK